MKLKLTTGDIPDPILLATPSLGLNQSLGGGLMSGRIHVFWGPKASGKTTTAMHVLAKAQQKGLRGLYVDAEKTYGAKWAMGCGIDTDQLELCRGNKVEDILETILPKIESKESNVIVLDSLSSIFVESFLLADGGNAIGIGARSMNNLVSKFLGALNDEVMIILIAHTTMAKSGQMMTAQAKLSESVKHWASSIIKFRQGMSKDNDRRADGSVKVYWQVEKSKQSLYPDDGSYWFNPQTISYDQMAELATLVVDKEIVRKSGAWIYVSDDVKYQGDAQFANALREDPELQRYLLAALNGGDINDLD